MKLKLQKILDNGGIKRDGENLYTPTLDEIGIEEKDWRQLKKDGLVENRGFGRTLSIRGRIKLLELKGIDPWK